MINLSGFSNSSCYTQPGSYTWVCPVGVNRVLAIVAGGAGSGAQAFKTIDDLLGTSVSGTNGVGGGNSSFSSTSVNGGGGAYISGTSIYNGVDYGMLLFHGFNGQNIPFIIKPPMGGRTFLATTHSSGGGFVSITTNLSSSARGGSSINIAELAVTPGSSYSVIVGAGGEFTISSNSSGQASDLKAINFPENGEDGFVHILW